MIALRYAWRSLSRSRLFVVVAILALAIGLGLSNTMFAVVDTIRNPVLAYSDPASLTIVAWRFSPRTTLSQAEFAQFIKARAQAIGPVTFLRRNNVRVEHGELVTTGTGFEVDSAYFRVTGTRLRLGRTFVATDGPDVAIVSDDTWRWAFGDGRDLNGATLIINGQARAIIGVVQRGRTVPENIGVWLTARASSDPAELTRSFPLVRLPPGMTYLQALGQFAALGDHLTRSYGSREAPIAVWSQPVGYDLPQIKDTHLAMTGAALCVLLVACVNLANLMLARGMARRRELALRMALGARRQTIVWQMFLECALITAGGIVVGAMLSLWGLYVLNNKVTGQVPLLGLLRPVMSWRVVAGSAIAAVLSAVVFGLLPAIRVAMDVSLDEPLKDGAGTTVRTRGRYSKLVMVEVALALVLMMGGGLLLRTIHEITSVEYTFEARTLLEAQVWNRHPTVDTTVARHGPRAQADLMNTPYRDALIQLVRSVPGVREAAISRRRTPIGGVLTGEMTGGDPTRTINTQGIEEVTWQYLRTFGLTILKGRDFEPGDAANQGAVILNPVAAQQLYPDREAVGHMIKLGGPERNAPWVPIIGVARSPMALRSGEEPVGPMIWLAGPDASLQRGGALYVRIERQDPAIGARVRAAINNTPPFVTNSPVPYAARRDAEVRLRTFYARAFVSMGMVALFLAAVGIYAVLAYAVNQRMREFAVRLALGAQQRQLFRMVMHDAAVMILAGTGIGAFGALTASRLIDSLLTNVLPSDVVTLVACEVILMSAGFLAAFAPAQRAVRANPLDILRAV